MTAYYKVRPAQNGVEGFIAWAGLCELTTDGPVSEPGDHVYISIAQTEHIAVESVKAETEKEHGTLTWIQCPPAWLH